jgi:hypothetical protein
MPLTTHIYVAGNGGTITKMSDRQVNADLYWKELAEENAALRVQCTTLRRELRAIKHYTGVDTELDDNGILTVYHSKDGWER